MSSLRDVDISSKSDSDLSDVPRNCEIERLEEILKGAGPLGSGSIDPCRCPECNPNVEGYAATATWTQDELLEADFRESVAAFTKDMQEIAPDLLGDLQIGFDPAELMKKQALQVPKHILPGDQVPRSSIGGFPHAIFRCFEVLPAKQCEVLLPALRLATTWITHPSMTLYWQNQIAAPRCLIPRHYNRPPDDDPDRVQRAALQHIIGWSQTNHEAWLKMLPNIARFNYFCFQDNEFGRPARAQMVTLESFRTRVSLSMASQIAMINLSQVANPDPGQLLRFNFQLANMLCHELAHVVEQLSLRLGIEVPDIGDMDEELAREPIWPLGPNFDWYEGEAGSAWNVYIFGCLTHAMNGRADDLYGLYGTDAYEDDGSDQPFFEGRALKMEQLYRLQQSEFYDSLDPSTFDVIPRIPLDRYGSCARAIGLLDINLWGRSTQDSASDIPTAVEEVSEQDMIDVDTEMGLVDEF